MILDLSPPFDRLWKNQNAFEQVRQIDGQIYRNKEGRRTLRFELDGQHYFLKHHQGVGWHEIVKNLLQLRQPVLGARNEYDAIRELGQCGIDTMTVLAFGEQGSNPAKQESFLVTEELTNTVSLEDVVKDWQEKPPSTTVKRAILRKVADISRRMHASGTNHRDFYLCHFLVADNFAERIEQGQSFACYLIDLHRARQRAEVPYRWRVKDMGGLYYSSLGYGFSRQDYLRFVRYYTQQPLKQTLLQDARFWNDVWQRASKIYQRDFGITPPNPFSQKSA